jgi:hypothetical protein
MKNKIPTKLSNCFLFLAVAFVMLLNPFIGKAQDASMKCEWVWKWVDVPRVINGGITYEKVYKYVYECSPNNNGTNATKTKEQDVSVSKVLIEGGEFSAPVDSPITGTWKYVEYGTTELPKIINSTVVMEKTPYVKRTLTFIFSQNGIVETIQNQSNLITGRGKSNWKYTAKTKTSGSLEVVLGDDVIYKGNVNFLNKNKLEYTITFSKNSGEIGNQYVWMRE